MAQQSERLPDLPCSDPMLVCSVCGCLLDKPQLLRCLHSCCRSCLQPSGACAMDEHQATAKPSCPVCQEASSNFTCNGFIGSRVSRYITITKSSLCSPCAGMGDAHQQAAAWCTSCRMSFCETCLSCHSSLHKDHSTTRIEEVKSFDEVFPLPAPLCSSHQKPYDFVCFSCKTCCCVDCWPSCSKLQHDMKHISDPIVASYVANARSDVANLARTLLSKVDVLSKRKQLTAALEIDRQNDLQKLKNSKLRLLKVIDDVCVTVEARLRDTYDGLKATADAISSSSEAMDHKVSHAATYSRYVVDVGLSSEVLMQEQSLLSRMKSLCTDLGELRQPLEAGQYVAFDSNLPDDETQLVDLVTSWMGSPRAITDDLCVRKAQPEISFVSTTVATSMADAGETPEERAERLREEREEAEFAEFVKTNGLKAVYGELRRRLDVWRSALLDIGVIGQLGSGKSTFINTVRRLKPMDPRAAATCVVETVTKPPTPYEHPRNPNVRLWDLPSVGTIAHPRDTYLKGIHFESYDFFIMISSLNFTEDVLWLVKEIKRERKLVYFVRTKIDDDIRHDKEDYREQHNEENVLTRVRDYCTKVLSDNAISEPAVFLTSKNPAHYDFPKFEARLIADLPELKREAFVLMLRSSSKSVIAEKAALLQKRAWMEAAACVIFDSKPVQRLSIIVNLEKISEVLVHYKSVFGLDNDGLTELSKSANVRKEDLIGPIGGHFWLDFTEAALIDAIAIANDERIQSSKAPAVPALGFILNSAPSYDATKFFLCKTIRNMQSAMITVLDTAFSKVAPKKMTSYELE